MVLRNARGPQHHPSREQPSCQKPYPTPAPHKHRLLLSTKGSESFFFFFFFGRVRGRGGGVLTCFLNQINGGEESVSNLRAKPLFPICGMMVGL